MDDIKLATVFFATDYVSRPSIQFVTPASPAELADLPGEYNAPSGMLLLALVDGEVSGCCSLRALDSVNYSNAAEIKRIYVRKAFRRFGLGRQLAKAVLHAARIAGYRSVPLDTLDDMESARALYTELGFAEIPPYY